LPAQAHNPYGGSLLPSLPGVDAAQDEIRPTPARLKLDLAPLAALPERPPLWAPGEPLFWDDPHIAQQMLQAHLSPSTDAASRRPDTIDRSVDWLAGQLELRAGDSVLDLGCGPGLYASRLARRGLRVTGVDYSRNSIRYAREQAETERLAVEYVYQDYRTLTYEETFDAALLIYYDIGALSPGDRDTVLANAHRALRPGARLAIDVLTPQGLAESRAESGWSASAGGGFWRPGPHLVLTRAVLYPAESVGLDEYVVVDETGQWTLYRVWAQAYTPEEFGALLGRHRFEVEWAGADLLGNPYAKGCEGLGVVARKV